MKNTRCFAVLIPVLLTYGCATTPNWRHSQITDEAAMSKQLKIDDGYCLLVANGAAPMPSISTTSPSTTNLYGQSRTYDQKTGSWTNSTFSGQAVTMPGGGFAGGFASGMNNGMALGALMAARRQQDAVYQACMLTKGWADVPRSQGVKNSGSQSVGQAPSAKNINGAYSQPIRQADVASEDVKNEWMRDVEEFLLLYPGYKKPNAYERLDAVVRKIANETPGMSGKQVLLRSRDVLARDGLIVEPTNDATMSMAARSYSEAVSGSASAQILMSMAYSYRDDQESQVRAAYWASLAAKNGSADGKIILGLQLFHGQGVAQDRVSAYRLIEQAALTSPDAAEMLPKLKAALTDEELARLH